MKRMLTLMTVVAVAAATPATFADSADDAARSAAEQTGAEPTKSMVATENEGGGRGEMSAPSQDQIARARSEQRAKDEAAVEEYNHERFLEDTWTKE